MTRRLAVSLTLIAAACGTACTTTTERRAARIDGRIATMAAANEVVCLRTVPIGSRIPIVDCRTVAERELEQLSNETLVGVSTDGGYRLR